MSIASLMPMPKLQFFGNDGKPLSGGLLYTAQPGTTAGPGQTNPKPTYTDSIANTANTNPVVLDSAGRANVWLIGYYKIALYDALGNLIYTADNVSSADNSNLPISSATVLALSAATMENIVNLPSGGEFIYIKTDSSQYPVTLVPQAGQTINGLSSYGLTNQNESAHIILIGNNWYLI